MKIILALLCLTANATTYYIAANGSDANNGTSKATPWAHLRGMPTCTGTCASTTPVAGDSFVFKGGDTWGYADLGISWTWNGTSESRIYIGVDKTWYTGGAWTRPILTCNGQACATLPGSARTQFQVWGAHVTVDDLEFTGLYMTSETGGDVSSIAPSQPGVEVKNCYFHGWTRDTVAAGYDIVPISSYTGGGGSQIAETSIHDNVIDGYSSYQAGVRTGMGIFSGASIYNNVIRYVFNGINGYANEIYNNLVEHVDFWASSGAHCNGIYHKVPVSGTVLRFYNNVLRNSSANGCVAFYTQGNTQGAAECPTCTTYFFNNVIYDVPNMGNPLVAFPGDSGSVGGTGYFYNNTVQTPTASCFGNGLGTVTGTLHHANNHCINSNGASGSVCGTGGGITCTDDSPGDSILETLASANTNGYCAPGVGGCTATWPFAPASGAAPTVGTGYNASALVSTFGAAFGSDTTLSISYDETNHRVLTNARTPVARGSTFDIGAYEWAAPPPPTTFRGVLRGTLK